MGKHGNNRNFILIWLAVGFLCALALCAQRMDIERGNCRVCAAMAPEDLAVLAESCGMATEELAREIGIVPMERGALCAPGMLVEDKNQYSHDPAFGVYVPDGENVRVFLMDGEYAARWGVLGYDGAQEIENMLYRAVTERNIRLVYLTLMRDAQSGEAVTDPAAYAGVVSGLSERISAHGLTLSDAPSAIPAHTPAKALLFLCAVGVIAAGLLLITAVFPRCDDPLLASALALGALFAGLLLRFFAQRWFFMLFAFAAAAAFPCLAVCFAVRRLKAAAPGSRGRELGQFAAALAGSLGIALLGGVFVAALQSGSDYLLAAENFRGVKLSQALPLLLCAALVLRDVCRPREILHGGRALAVLLVLAAAGAAAVFLLRTGNSAVSVIEQRARSWLELTLITRPRTKEFLVGWPCLALASALLSRTKPHLAWPFAVFSAVGASSVVNTFCHSRAPVWLSLTRSVLGALIGCGIGLVLLCLLYRKSGGDGAETDQ